MKPVYNILYLNVLPKYNLLPLLKVVQDPDTGPIDYLQTELNFVNNYNNLYFPVLTLLKQNKTSFNLVVTGYFLDLLKKKFPSGLDLLKEVLRTTKSEIFIDSYYGNNLTSYFHHDWWVESLKKTREVVSKVNLGEVQGIYIPQLFKEIPLEKITEIFGYNNFLTRIKDRTGRNFQMDLKTFRQSDENPAPWINTENNVTCQFRLIPDINYYSINGNLFQPDILQAAKTFALALAFRSEQEVVKTQQKLFKPSNKPIKLNKRYSLYLYSNLARAVIRMWSRVAQILWTEYQANPTKLMALKEEYAFVQNTEYFYYFMASAYKYQKIQNFSSPYEAFVNMQSICKKIEISLYNKI